MQMNVQTSVARPGPPLYRARQKTGRVREQLKVASAELGLTNTGFDHSLPESIKQSTGQLIAKEACDNRGHEFPAPAQRHFPARLPAPFH